MSKIKPDQNSKVSFFNRFLKSGESLFQYVERVVNHGFGERQNWFYYLGALPVLFLLILLFSGLYLFIYYDLSLTNAYDSVNNVTHSWFGNLMRSVHRYSADAMILFALVHMLRIFVKKYYQNHRWLAWVSGIIIMVFLLIQGVTGYILPLDSTANFVMQESAVLLGSVKIFGNTLSRSFASPGNSGKWIMWIIMIVHLAIPMLALFGIFIHIKRVSRARIFPPKSIIWGALSFIIIFSLIFPLGMLDRADPYKQVYLQELDWFYLFLSPIMTEETSLYIWAGFFGLMIVLTVVPWLSRSPKIYHAQLELSDCTGCNLCAQDCPYEAIAMHPRTDGLSYKLEAQITEDLCSGCGICIGSCDFNALNLQEQTVDDPHNQIKDTLKTNTKDIKPILGIVCNNQAKNIPEGTFMAGKHEVRVLPLECVGKFGISMLETATQAGAGGVVAYSCPSGNCGFREGNQWFEDRMIGLRKPKFRRVKQAPPVGMIHVDGSSSIVDKTRLLLDKLDKNKKPILSAILGKNPLAMLVSSLIVFIFGGILYVGAVGSGASIPLDTSASIVRLDFFYKTDKKACSPELLDKKAYKKAVKRLTNQVKMTNLTPEARKRLVDAAHANALSKFCSRDRRPLELRLFLNKKLQLTKTFFPSGLQNDGLIYVLHEQAIQPGTYTIRLEVNAEGKKIGPIFEEVREFKGAQKFFIDFDKNQGRFIGR